MFKYINAAISGEYQKVLSRLIEDPETLALTDTPTFNLPNSVPTNGAQCRWFSYGFRKIN